MVGIDEIVGRLGIYYTIDVMTYYGGWILMELDYIEKSPPDKAKKTIKDSVDLFKNSLD